MKVELNSKLLQELALKHRYEYGFQEMEEKRLLKLRNRSERYL
jgi:hypothetical protein